MQTALVDGHHGLTVDQHLDILRQQAQELHVVLNFWSVCSYDNQESLGHVWKPLVQATGGDFHRFSLRINPQDEKWRLQEALRRYFAKPLATKCLFRWRGTPMLYVVPGSMAGCVGTSIAEGDTFQANCIDADTSISMRLAMDDARRVEGWNSFDQKMPASSRSGSGRHSFARGSAAGGGSASREDKLADAVVMQLVFSYESIESFPAPVTVDAHTTTSSTGVSHGKVDTPDPVAAAAVDDDDNHDPWAFFRQGMDIWGHEWRLAFEQLLFPDRRGHGIQSSAPASAPASATATVYDFMDDDLSEEDHEKVMILRKLFATYNATLEAKRNPSSSSSSSSISGQSGKTSSSRHRHRFKNFHLRRDRAYPVDHVLVVRKHVRVVTLCLECTNNITKLRESCNLSVAMGLMLREALHHVGGGGGGGGGDAGAVAAGVSPSPGPGGGGGGGGMDAVDQLVQRLHRNVGGEKDLFNAMMSVLHRAATLKEVELRTIYQKRNGGGHYTVDIASLHRFLMVDEPYTRDVIHTLYRALARVLASIESDPLTIRDRSVVGGKEHTLWSTPRVHDEMIDWMFLVLRAAPPVAVQLLIPNLRGIHIHHANVSSSTTPSIPSSMPLTPPTPSATLSTSTEAVVERPATQVEPSTSSGKAILGEGKLVQFDDTGLLSHDSDTTSAKTTIITAPPSLPPGATTPTTTLTTTVPTTDSIEESTIDSQSQRHATPSAATTTTSTNDGSSPFTGRILMTTEALPLRRDAMMSSSSELFLLDAGSEIILYQPMTFRKQRTAVSHRQQEQEQPTSVDVDGLYKSVFPFLSFRLLDHPLLPRLILAEAGEHSAHAFTSHMLEDHSSDANAMSFAECKQLTLRILEAINFDSK